MTQPPKCSNPTCTATQPHARHPWTPEFGDTANAPGHIGRVTILRHYLWPLDYVEAQTWDGTTIAVPTNRLTRPRRPR